MKVGKDSVLCSAGVTDEEIVQGGRHLSCRK